MSTKITGFPAATTPLDGTEIPVLVQSGSDVQSTTQDIANLAASLAADPGTAPGAGKARMYWVAGTTPGTAKLIAYAGTSSTPVTIVDNVGGGF